MRSVPQTSRGAFTLIEVLVVILILTILASLVIGVAQTVRMEMGKRKTILTQDTVMSAIKVYFDVWGLYPAEGASSGAVIPDSVMSDMTYYGGDHYAHPYYKECMASKVRNGSLYAQLMREPDSAKAMQSLSPDALFMVPNQLWSMPGVNYVIRDGYNNDMDYRASAGLGGRPVLISAGPDGAFGFGTFTNSDKDNIRSDGQNR